MLLALLFVAFTIVCGDAAGVEALARRHVPRPLGVALHYAAFIGLLALFSRLRRPGPARAGAARDRHRPERQGCRPATSLQDKRPRRPRTAPAASAEGQPSSIHPALAIGEKALAVLVGVFFTFAAAAYWLFERDRAIDLVTSFLPRPRRKKVRDTWILIDLKLGAFVRGQLMMIALVSTVVSAAFWLVGRALLAAARYRSRAVEIVPVVGPLIGLILTVAAGLSVTGRRRPRPAASCSRSGSSRTTSSTRGSWAAIVGLSPLIVMVSAIAVTTLFGPFYVLSRCRSPRSS